MRPASACAGPARRVAAAPQRCTRTPAAARLGAATRQSGPALRDVRAAFFNFNKLRTDSSDAGIYGSQGRDDYSVDDVEHYFNYMGMLAVEGTYDRMEAMLASGAQIIESTCTLHRVDAHVPAHTARALLRCTRRPDRPGTSGRPAADGKQRERRAQGRGASCCGSKGGNH